MGQKSYYEFLWMLLFFFASDFFIDILVRRVRVIIDPLICSWLYREGGSYFFLFIPQKNIFGSNFSFKSIKIQLLSHMWGRFYVTFIELVNMETFWKPLLLHSYQVLILEQKWTCASVFGWNVLRLNNEWWSTLSHWIISYISLFCPLISKIWK